MNKIFILGPKSDKMDQFEAMLKAAKIPHGFATIQGERVNERYQFNFDGTLLPFFPYGNMAIPKSVDEVIFVACSITKNKDILIVNRKRFGDHYSMNKPSMSIVVMEEDAIDAFIKRHDGQDNGNVTVSRATIIHKTLDDFQMSDVENYIREHINCK